MGEFDNPDLAAAAQAAIKDNNWEVMEAAFGDSILPELGLAPEEDTITSTPARSIRRRPRGISPLVSFFTEEAYGRELGLPLIQEGLKPENSTALQQEIARLLKESLTRFTDEEIRNYAAMTVGVNVGLAAAEAKIEAEGAQRPTPGRTKVPEGEFIPEDEDTRSLAEIDEQVYREVTTLLEEGAKLNLTQIGKNLKLSRSRTELSVERLKAASRVTGSLKVLQGQRRREILTVDLQNWISQNPDKHPDFEAIAAPAASRIGLKKGWAADILRSIYRDLSSH